MQDEMKIQTTLYVLWIEDGWIYQNFCFKFLGRSKTCIILLGLMTDDFAPERGSSRLERIKRI